MRKVSWFFRLSLALALVAAIVIAGLDNQSGASTALAATAAATKAAATAKPAFTECAAPPPTSTPKPTNTPKPTKAATSAATTVATMAATLIATEAPTVAATVAATTAATTAATAAATATAVPPTATTIPVGGKPASLGAILTLNVAMLRNDKACVAVKTLTAGGPADVAGILVGDLILGFDKEAVKDTADFSAQLLKHKSGDKVTITIQRAGAEQAISVELGLNPYADTAVTAAPTTAATKAAATMAATK